MSSLHLVGGFNHLEKYESQWEGLSHILWNIIQSCLKPPVIHFLKPSLTRYPWNPSGYMPWPREDDTVSDIIGQWYARGEILSHMHSNGNQTLCFFARNSVCKVDFWTKTLFFPSLLTANASRWYSPSGGTGLPNIRSANLLTRLISIWKKYDVIWCNYVYRYIYI